MSKKVIVLVLGVVFFFMAGIFVLKWMKTPKVKVANVKSVNQTHNQTYNQTQAQVPIEQGKVSITENVTEMKGKDSFSLSSLEKAEDECKGKKVEKRKRVVVKKKENMPVGVEKYRDFGNVIGSVCVNGICSGITKGKVGDGEFISYRYQSW